MKKVTPCVFIIIVAISCKKNPKTDVVPSSSSSPVPVYGVLTCSRYSDIPNLGYRDTIVNTTFNAYFTTTNDPPGYPIPDSEIRVKSVSVNGTSLSEIYNAHGYYTYNGYTDLSGINSANWVVEGQGEIPSFTYLHAFPLPWASKFSGFKDTVYLSKGYTVDLGRLYNITKGSVELYSFGKGSVKDFKMSAREVFFDPEELQAAISYTVVWATLSLNNSIVANCNGKDFLFSKEVKFKKVLVVKP